MNDICPQLQLNVQCVGCDVIITSLCYMKIFFQSVGSQQNLACMSALFHWCFIDLALELRKNGHEPNCRCKNLSWPSRYKLLLAVALLRKANIHFNPA